MLCNTLGKLCIVRRTQRNFEFVAETENFSAVELVDDDQTVAYLTNGSAGKRKELAVMRRTGFIKDFMKNSYSSDLADSYAEKTTPLMLAAALAVGLLSIVFEKKFIGRGGKALRIPRFRFGHAGDKLFGRLGADSKPPDG